MGDTELNFIKEDGRIYAEDENGATLCEVKWAVADGVANIHRTYVQESLGGRGLAGKLVAMAVEDLEAAGLALDATCSYAAKWLEKNRPGIVTTASKNGPSCSL